MTKSPLQLLTDAVTRTQATGLSMNYTDTNTPLNEYLVEKYIQSVGENLIKQQNYKKLYTFNRFFIIFMN